MIFLRFNSTLRKLLIVSLGDALNVEMLLWIENCAVLDSVHFSRPEDVAIIVLKGYKCHLFVLCAACTCLFFFDARVKPHHTHTHTHRTSMRGGGRRSACLLPSRLLHQYWKGAESHSECPRNLSLLAHPPPPASFLPPPPSSAANTALIAPASLGPSFLDPHCTDATSSRVAETSLDTVPKR